MRIKSAAMALFLSILIAGCAIDFYRYESTGQVLSSSGETSKALIYWYADENGIWYDEDQTALDSDVSLRVCEGAPKDFVPHGDSQNLIIRSRSGDQLTAKIAANGDIVELQPPKRLRVGDGNCGQIEVSGKKVVINNLPVNVEPDVIILCENIRNSDSYPKFGRYKFKNVTRTKIKSDNRSPADFCGSE